MLDLELDMCRQQSRDMFSEEDWIKFSKTLREHREYVDQQVRRVEQLEGVAQGLGIKFASYKDQMAKSPEASLSTMSEAAGFGGMLAAAKARMMVRVVGIDSASETAEQRLAGVTKT